ncbi:MAG: hypothetical protein HZC24_01890 [Rhodocyclales bacterium]|nr:hypothetical protein [Rhodocyclales bacterium]
MPFAALACRCVALVAALGLAAPAGALESIRAQEIRECRSGEIATWGDGRDRSAYAAALSFTYNPVGAPPWFPEALVAGQVAKAAHAWSRCGVPVRTIPWPGKPELRPGLVVVQWNETESGGNFGLANFSRGTLSLGPKAFQLLRTRNPAHDASETLQMVISHEMGHLFGLMAHSRRCVDVLSYYNNSRGEKCLARGDIASSGVVEYRHSLPTACDIERCRRANRKSPLTGGR